MLIAKLQEDVQGFVKVSLGFSEPLLVLGDHAEIVVSARRTVPIAELKEEVEGFAIAGLGFSEPPLTSGHRAKLEIAKPLSPTITNGLKKSQLDAVMRRRIAEPMLIQSCGPSQAMKLCEFMLLLVVDRVWVHSDGIFDQPAPGVMLLSLVQVLIQRPDQRTDELACT